jgi:hypothetical protein
MWPSAAVVVLADQQAKGPCRIPVPDLTESSRRPSRLEETLKKPHHLATAHHASLPLTLLEVKKTGCVLYAGVPAVVACMLS